MDSRAADPLPLEEHQLAPIGRSPVDVSIAVGHPEGPDRAIQRVHDQHGAIRVDGDRSAVWGPKDVLGVEPVS